MKNQRAGLGKTKKENLLDVSTPEAVTKSAIPCPQALSDFLMSDPHIAALDYVIGL